MIRCGDDCVIAASGCIRRLRVTLKWPSAFRPIARTGDPRPAAHPPRAAAAHAMRSTARGPGIVLSLRSGDRAQRRRALILVGVLATAAVGFSVVASQRELTRSDRMQPRAAAAVQIRAPPSGPRATGRCGSPASRSANAATQTRGLGNSDRGGRRARRLARTAAGGVRSWTRRASSSIRADRAG